MLTNYTYEYRLYPTKQQCVLLAKHFGSARFIYNHFLDQRTKAYQEQNETLNYYDNSKLLPQLKAELPWLREINSQSLQHSIKHLQNAYNRFFKKLGKFPCFKSKHNKQSFSVPQYTQIKDNRLIIPKFKEGIKIKLSRPIEGTIRNATIVQNKAGQYYAKILVQRDIKPLPVSNRIVALDLNIKHIVDNNGTKHSNPLPETTKYKNKLKLLNKSISRKEKRSNSRGKAQLKLNKVKQRTHNIREDFLHKLSRTMINENQVVVVEDLNVRNMLSNSGSTTKLERKRLHRSIQDASFSSFLSKLVYKCNWYGRMLVKVDRYYPSSQLCSNPNCNYRNRELRLGEQEWTCSSCNTKHDRDINASKNILNEGLKILKRTVGTTELADRFDVRLANEVS